MNFLQYFELFKAILNIPIELARINRNLHRSAERLVEAINTQGDRLMAALDDLKQDVVDLNTSVSNEIAAVAQAIAAAQQGGDGSISAADAQAIHAQLRAVKKTIDDETAALAKPTSFSIMGTIAPLPGGAGVTVALSGVSAASVTSDDTGVYSFTKLAPGQYTVTPSKTGVTFTPPSQPVGIDAVNVTGVNFTAA